MGQERTTIRLGLPKGSMQREVFTLLEEAGLPVACGQRDYRPTLPLPGIETKLLKPQNIVEMLDRGSRDVGFCGADWVEELGADLGELLDTGLDPVRVVAAAPQQLSWPPAGRVVVASEYEKLTRDWIADRGLDASFLRSFGATEVFPPEDADVIVDNTASGATLRANGLVVVDELTRSTTRLYASRAAMADPQRMDRIETIVLLLRSVLDARRRVMLEVNVVPDLLEAVCSALPCMREPTIAPLHDSQGYAVKAAVPRDALPTLIPEVRAAGGTDLVVQRLDQIIA